MAVDLVFRVTMEIEELFDLEWQALLRLTRLYGWDGSPGTNGPVGACAALLGADDPFEVPWTGGYRIAIGDRVDGRVSLAMASALENAIPDLPRRNTWSLLREVGGFPRNVSPHEWFGGRDQDLAELVRKLRAGGGFVLTPGDVEQELHELYRPAGIASDSLRNADALDPLLE